jgi:hypothetical protein
MTRLTLLILILLVALVQLYMLYRAWRYDGFWAMCKLLIYASLTLAVVELSSLAGVGQ